MRQSLPFDNAGYRVYHAPVAMGKAPQSKLDKDGLAFLAGFDTVIMCYVHGFHS
jgi:hypothetical protein